MGAMKKILLSLALSLSAGLAERQYSRTVVLQAQRGPIVDRTGAPPCTAWSAT